MGLRARILAWPRVQELLTDTGAGQRPRMTKRMGIAVGLVVLQGILSWPAMTLTGGIAAALGHLDIAAGAPPILYVVSWVILGIAVLLGGRDCLGFARRWNRWILRRFLAWSLGHPPR